ncbi:MAG: ABC transporter permease [Desulfovibrio sp.]|nr:ABC transporter permease [Desulfovibrio sp.]
MAETTDLSKEEKFTFQRMGGINQVLMHTDYDWRNLDKLDPKLWMAMSCPVAGLEFSHATLELLDADHDGRIRAQEVREAASWICERLVHPSILADSPTEIKLTDLRDDTDAGKGLISAFRIALEQCGKEQGSSLTDAEIAAVLEKASGYAFNGDGVITMESATQAAAANAALKAVPAFVKHGFAIVGAVKDASGLPGMDQKLADQLISRAKAVVDWRKKVSAVDLPLGEQTGEAWTLLQRLEPKLEDYFNRCQLAAYAPDAADDFAETALVRQIASTETNPAAAAIDHETLLSLPLAKIDSSCELDLRQGLNPAWAPDMEKFTQLLAPLLGSSAKLSLASWRAIWQKFAPFAAVLDAKPSYAAAPADATVLQLADLPPLAAAPACDALGRAWLASNPDEALFSLPDAELASIAGEKSAFSEVVQQDLAAPALASFQDLNKLALYCANLYTFLMNFLSFMDFYNPDKKAIFQTGTLYLNSCGCMLSVPVENIETHAVLAAPSHLCLIYCECSRTEDDGSLRNMTIASALTQGSLADLLDGRHGLFIDNDGLEWDTRIARIVHNPVSLREAVWSPYVRLANMASQQIQKFVSKKEEDASQKLTESATAVAQGAKPEKPAFDFAKGAGIFAALGVALSAVSAAFAYIANSLASLGWLWPLAIVLVLICISGPSVILAWLKLRKRSLGPLLDASGWAVNKGAPINLAMGTFLTSVGKLPPNASLDPHDPYSLPGKALARKWKTRFWLAVFLLILIAIGCFWLWCKFLGEPLWFFQLRAMLGI